MGDQAYRALQELQAAVRRDPDVLAVILFGSAARGERGPASDLDVCLVLTPEAARAGKKAMGEKRLDYLGRFPFDIQVFQQLPVYIRPRVLRDGRVLLVKDEAQLYDLAYRTIKAFDDFRAAYDEYLAQVARARS
ncbi:MAG TPA: nucleotidyltransferase domain-containing protein [bacterium]|nr:nucleotidyltransferase domain-containing protein [bacterium]